MPNTDIGCPCRNVGRFDCPALLRRLLPGGPLGCGGASGKCRLVQANSQTRRVENKRVSGY